MVRAGGNGRADAREGGRSLEASRASPPRADLSHLHGKISIILLGKLMRREPSTGISPMRSNLTGLNSSLVLVSNILIYGLLSPLNSTLDKHLSMLSTLIQKQNLEEITFNIATIQYHKQGQLDLQF